MVNDMRSRVSEGSVLSRRRSNRDLRNEAGELKSGHGEGLHIRGKDQEVISHVGHTFL